MKVNTAPRSDQYNADDFVGGAAKTFVIANVTEGSAEGARHDVHLQGEQRVWRPPVTTLRIMEEAWGSETDDWIGKRVTLYRDSKVKFGKDTPGGIRISHMSHLPRNERMTLPSTVTRGRKSLVTVEPLPDLPPAITDDAVAEFNQRIETAATLDELKTIGADLKAWDLGTHKQALQAAWAERSKQLKSAQGESDKGGAE